MASIHNEEHGESVEGGAAKRSGEEKNSRVEERDRNGEKSRGHDEICNGARCDREERREEAGLDVQRTESNNQQGGILAGKAS